MYLIQVWCDTGAFIRKKKINETTQMLLYYIEQRGNFGKVTKLPYI